MPSHTTSPDPADFLDIDSELDSDELAIRDTVRDFAEHELAPYVGEWFEEGALPVRELAAKFGKLGVFGMHLDGYGCAGLSATAYAIACRELEAVDSVCAASSRFRGPWR